MPTLLDRHVVGYLNVKAVTSAKGVVYFVVAAYWGFTLRSDGSRMTGLIFSTKKSCITGESLLGN